MIIRGVWIHVNTLIFNGLLKAMLFFNKIISYSLWAFRVRQAPCIFQSSAGM
jgi:hypothetical protein